MIFFAALVLATPGASAVPIQGTFEADHIQSQGNVSAVQDLTSLLHPFPTATDAVFSGFELHADHVRMETDRAEVALVIDDVAAYRPLPETNVEHYTDVTIKSLEAGGGYRFDVAPLDPGALVTIESGCSRQTASTDGEIHRVPIVQSQDRRPDHVVDVGNAIQWSDCDKSARTTVKGNFWVSLWAIGVEIQTPSGTDERWSGHGEGQILVEDRELFLYVTNGVLEMPLARGTGHALFLAPTGQVDVIGSVQFGAAQGSIAVSSEEMPLLGESLAMAGTFGMHRTVSQGTLQVTMSGDADNAVLGGAAVVFLDAPPDARLQFDTWMFLVLFTVAGIIGVRFLVHRYGAPGRAPSIMPSTRRQWRAVRLLSCSVRANERGWHRASKWLAAGASRRFPELPEARKMLAIATSHLGRHEEALSILADVYDDLPSGRQRAEAACCAAATCMRMKDQKNALKWIRQGFSEDPLFVLRRLDKPIYAPLRSHGAFEAMQAGSAALLGNIARDVAFA